MIWVPHGEGRKLEQTDPWIGEQWAVALEKEGKDTVEVPLTSMPEEWQGRDGDKKERTAYLVSKKTLSGTNVREHPEKKEKDLSLRLLCMFLLSNDIKSSDTFLSLSKSCKEPWAQAMFSLSCTENILDLQPVSNAKAFQCSPLLQGFSCRRQVNREKPK